MLQLFWAYNYYFFESRKPNPERGFLMPFCTLSVPLKYNSLKFN